MTKAEKLAWLAWLEVGCEVVIVIPGQWHRSTRYEIAKITRMTRTRVIIDGRLHRRVYTSENGYGYGKTKGRIEPVTDEVRAIIAERDLRERFTEIARKAEYSETFPLYAVRAMVEAYDQALAEHGEKERSKCQESR